MTRTAFVTGANGFIGVNLIEELLDQGWRVVAMHRERSDLGCLQALDVERVVADVTDSRALRRVMPEAPDAVFHLAGVTSLWKRRHAEQMRTNVKGTRNVVRIALEKRAQRLVHVSSILAYGLHSGTVTEDTPASGGSATINYVRSKALAEREVHRAIRRGLDAVIINPSHAIGPYDRNNWSRLFMLMRQGRLPGMPPGGGSFCHSRAVARAMIAAVDRGRRGANYLLGGSNASYVKLAHEIAKMLGRRTRPRPMPTRLLLGYARVEELVAPLFGREPDITTDAVRLLSWGQYCSSRRAEQELGYELVPLQVMLEDCCRWLRDSGRLKV